MINPLSQIVGILNITEDSFSDGGKFLAPEAALAQARKLRAEGADILDIGAASSRPDALAVSVETEIGRLSPVVAALKAERAVLSVDSFAPAVQLWALDQRVDFINDVRGFPEPQIYPQLAASDARLIVMHSVAGEGPAVRRDVPADRMLARIIQFFETRLGALEAAGVARDRLILDPGMGLFLGTDLDASLIVLRGLGRLKAHFGLPLLVGASRKSFLRKLADVGAAESGPASLAAELYAMLKGVDFIRTHAPGPLTQALRVWRALGP